MENKLKVLRDILNKEGIWQYKVLSINEASTLKIIGSTDLSYFHNIEIVFTGITYISCPITFSDATFRFANEKEINELKKGLMSEWNDIILCIELDEYDINKNQLKYFVFAENLQYKTGIVYHYRRENLKENEKVGD